MDRRERIPAKGSNALLLAIRAALDAHQAGMWTALPAFVSSYNAEKLTVEAQPTLQGQVRQPDGTWTNTNMPLCVDCPVAFPGGGGFALTFPLAKNDEGILVFASRCIDSWWQSGGIQKQAELRMHDLSDGFFFPTGGISLPNIPGNASTDTCQLRSKDGNTVIELAAGNIINIAAPGGINFSGPVTFNNEVTFLAHLNGQAGGGGTVNFGNAIIATTGNMQAANLITPSVASYNVHTHGGVAVGAVHTAPPDP